MVEVCPLDAYAPLVDGVLGACEVVGVSEEFSDLGIGIGPGQDLCWRGRIFGVEVAPPAHGFDLTVQTHSSVVS